MFKVGEQVALNKFDFDNNFYVLELIDGTTFIATHEDIDEDIWGLSNEDKTQATCLDKEDIKKIIASISKRIH